MLLFGSSTQKFSFVGVTKPPFYPKNYYGLEWWVFPSPKFFWAMLSNDFKTKVVQSKCCLSVMLNLTTAVQIVELNTGTQSFITTSSHSLAKNVVYFH